MGTGKSLQALVAMAMAHLGSTKNCTSGVSADPPQLRSLIVCPSTLVGHWASEIEKYFPLNSIFTFLCLEGGSSERLEKWRWKSIAVNVVITSYSVLRSDIDYLEREKWCYCVLDEGHLLKNPKTGT
jgi:TATA-binding protein-associated factor